jgi:hypothetical protein
MKCGDFQDRISKFLENEMSDGERDQMDRHASGCSRCEASLEEMRLLTSQLNRLTRVQPSVGFDFALRSRLLIEAAESMPLLSKLEEYFAPAIPKLVWSGVAVAILAVAATSFLEDRGDFEMAETESVEQMTVVAPSTTQPGVQDRQGALRRLSQEASYPISQRLYSSRSDSVNSQQTTRRAPIARRGITAGIRKVSFRF